MTSLDVAAIYAEYRPLVYRYLRKRVDSHETAEDLVAETFVKALRGGYREQGRVASWLLTTAQRVWIDHYRRQDACRRAYDRLDVSRATADAGSERHVDRLAVAWAIDRLSPGQRKATLAVDLDGATHAEVAATWGSTVNTVKKYRYWARIRLRQHLEAAS